MIEKTAQSKEKLDIAKLASIMQTFSMNHSVSDLGGKMLNAVQSWAPEFGGRFTVFRPRKRVSS